MAFRQPGQGCVDASRNPQEILTFVHGPYDHSPWPLPEGASFIASAVGNQPGRGILRLGAPVVSLCPHSPKFALRPVRQPCLHSPRARTGALGGDDLWPHPAEADATFIVEKAENTRAVVVRIEPAAPALSLQPLVTQ